MALIYPIEALKYISFSLFFASFFVILDSTGKTATKESRRFVRIDSFEGRGSKKRQKQEKTADLFATDRLAFCKASLYNRKKF